jgi:hypothetical protein
MFCTKWISAINLNLLSDFSPIHRVFTKRIKMQNNQNNQEKVTSVTSVTHAAVLLRKMGAGGAEGQARARGSDWEDIGEVTQHFFQMMSRSPRSGW